MAKQLTENERAQIIALINEQITLTEIAKKFNVSVSTIHRTKKKFDKHGLYKHIGNNGRRSKCTEQVMSILVSENKKNSKKSLRKMQSIIENKCSVAMSHVTCKNYLNSIGIFAFYPLKRPFLSKKILKPDMKFHRSE